MLRLFLGTAVNSLRVSVMIIWFMLRDFVRFTGESSLKFSWQFCAMRLAYSEQAMLTQAAGDFPMVIMVILIVLIPGCVVQAP